MDDKDIGKINELEILADQNMEGVCNMLNRYSTVLHNSEPAGLLPLIPSATTNNRSQRSNCHPERQTILSVFGVTLCVLSVLLLLLTSSLAGARPMPLPTHDAGFYKAGTVSAVAMDAEGRFYIGGTFRFVNGVPRNNLARFNADGTLDTTWNPNPDKWVFALAVSGNTVYVGGEFTTIGGQLRSCIAALDATTGTATAWGEPGASGWVYTLVISGNTVYAGGGVRLYWWTGA